MQKGSKHSDEAREMMKSRAQQREAPVVRYKRHIDELQAWCERYPNAVKAIETSAQKGSPWARDLLRLLRPTT
jgi:hypothetical protein